MNINYTDLILFFQTTLLDWYKLNGRALPWRDSSCTIYERIIAEVLLQRTKVETVQKFFPLFIEKYPSWEVLANSDIEAIGNFIRPLGLKNQRSTALKKLAEALKQQNYRLPENRVDLEKLPGVGQYIASAILLFYKKKREPMLDVNMQRLLERFFGPRQLIDIRYDPYLQNLSRDVVNCASSVQMNFAILDFASLVCVRKKPRCNDCLLIKKCLTNNIISYELPNK